MSATQPKYVFFATFAVTILLVAIACFVAAHENAAGISSFHSLDNFTGALVLIGGIIGRNAPIVYWGGLGVSLVPIIAVSIQARSKTFLILAASCFLAACAELCLLHHWYSAGALGFFIAAFPIFFFSGPEVEEGRQPQWNLVDGAMCLTAVLCAIFFRFYALDGITDYFEGELASYSAGADTFSGMVRANRATSGPWAPLGLLYYAPLYATINGFGSTVLAIRLSSAMVGVLTVPLVYLLMRRVSGTPVAAISTMFFALNQLHIGWSRTDVHPHGVTAWPALLLAWVTIEAFESGRRSAFLLMALSMGLTWHQYPSGQSAVIIPLIALVMHSLATFRLSRFDVRSLPWIAIGLILWFLGLPLSYALATHAWEWTNPFTTTGPRALWGSEPRGTIESLSHVLSGAVAHGWDLVQGVFLRVPYLFHQDFLPNAPDPYGNRTVPWAIAAFAAVGLFMALRRIRDFRYTVLVAWLIVAILPGVLSERAYPKRASMLYVVIDCFAALPLGLLLQLSRDHLQRIAWRSIQGLTIAAFLGYGSMTAWFWFSERQWKYGHPPELPIARAIAKEIAPHTIVIADLSEYEPAKYLYLLLDHLSAPAHRPNAWLVASGPAAWSMAWDDPVWYSRYSKAHAWFYDRTRLRAQQSDLLTNAAWTKVVFVIQERSRPRGVPNVGNSEAVIANCAEPTIERFARRGRMQHDITMVTCALENFETRRMCPFQQTGH